MPTAPSALTQTQTQDKFNFDKLTVRGVTLLTMHGTLHHAFEGRKVAEAVQTKKVILSMRDVRRFSSWGMSEWMEFQRIHQGADIYIIECSTYAVSQLNLVTGLLGNCKLVSFYASYRCGSCSEELETLFLIPRDRAAIRELPGSHQECTTCAGRARLEEYPAAFFDLIADRPSFDLDDEVLAFLRAQFGYDLPPDLMRFRAHRRVKKDYTYIRLSGSIAALPGPVLANASHGSTVVDLDNIVFDPNHVAPWRSYVQAALPKVRSLQLLNCPVGFLQSAVAPEDLHDKLKVRNFAVSYECARCRTTTGQMVDVAANLEQLVTGAAPPAHCTTCNSLLVPSLTSDEIVRMRALPARDRDPGLDGFLTKARTEPTDKLEDCLAAKAVEPPQLATKATRAIYVAMALTGVVLTGLAVIAVMLWNQREPAAGTSTPSTAVTPAKPTFERPDWVLSDIPSSAFCHDMINRLMCVGVSSYRPSRDEAVVEANDVALEELVSSVGLKIGVPQFKDTVMTRYSDVRTKALSALQAAESSRASAAYAAALDVVTKARRRVVEILQASGGAAVPAQRSDWYWEEYEAKKGGTEFLVFVRYDVTLDAIKALVEKYSALTRVSTSTMMTAFPALAWSYADFTGGAMMIRVGEPFASAGVLPQEIVMAVGEQRVADVTSFARRLDEWKRATGDLTLTVKTTDAPARVVQIKRQRIE